MRNLFYLAAIIGVGFVHAEQKATAAQAASAANAVSAASQAQQTGMFLRPSWCPGGNCQGCVNNYCPQAGQNCAGGNCGSCVYNNGQYYCPVVNGQCPNGNCNGCLAANGQTYCPNYNGINGINGVNGLNNGINGCPNGNCNGCIQGNGLTYCPTYNGGCPNGNCNGCINQNNQQYCPTNNIYNGGINGINGINSGSCINTNGQYYCPSINGQCPNNNCAGCISQNGQQYCPSGSSINGITNGINGVNGLIGGLNGGGLGSNPIPGVNGVPSNFVYGQTSLYVDPTGTYTFYFTPTSTSASCTSTNNGQSSYRQCISYFYGSNGAATTITGYTGAPTTWTYTETSTQVFYNVQSQCFNNGLGTTCVTNSIPTSQTQATYTIVSRAAATRAADPAPIARGVIAQGIAGVLGLGAAMLL